MGDDVKRTDQENKQCYLCNRLGVLRRGGILYCDKHNPSPSGFVSPDPSQSGKAIPPQGGSGLMPKPRPGRVKITITMNADAVFKAFGTIIKWADLNSETAGVDDVE